MRHRPRPTMLLLHRLAAAACFAAMLLFLPAARAGESSPALDRRLFGFADAPRGQTLLEAAGDDGSRDAAASNGGEAYGPATPAGGATAVPLPPVLLAAAATFAGLLLWRTLRRLSDRRQPALSSRR